MSLEFYKVLHLIGLICLFTGIGGFLTYGNDQPPRVKMAAILHGVGVLLMIVSGFGMLAKLPGVGFPAWVAIKSILWITLVAILPLAKRGVISPRNAIIVGIAAGFAAAYIGLTWKSGFVLSIPGAAG